MSDDNMPEIKPALTAEQWAGLQGSHGIPVEISAVLAVENDEWHEGMALCNAALPDDDPRKLVRADVEACLSVARHWEYKADESLEWGHRELQYEWERRAAKLAALLPPEGQPQR